MLHPELSSDEDVRTGFLREGHVANKIDHPGAVDVLDDDTTVAYPVLDILAAAHDKTTAPGSVVAIVDKALAFDKTGRRGVRRSPRRRCSDRSQRRPHLLPSEEAP